MYDYWLGGRDNYEVDRMAAEEVLASLPSTLVAMRANRAFLHRAVRTIARAGVSRFLDIGTGIPTSPNTHETAREVIPDARVVYVDNDPIVAVHAAARLTNTPGTAFALADLRDPHGILQHPVVAALLADGEPVGLLLVAVLHFITDAQNPAGIVATLRDALPPGSYLAISHGTHDMQQAYDTAALERVYTEATSTMNLRPHAEVLGFFDGFDVLDPGLVTISEWRPDVVDPDLERFGMYSGVGRKL